MTESASDLHRKSKTFCAGAAIMTGMDSAVRMVKFKATMARKRKAERLLDEEEDARYKLTPEELAITSIRDSRLEYTFTRDGSIGSVRLRVLSDPACCVYAHFDSADMDSLAPYLLYARWHGNKERLQPFAAYGQCLGAKNYYSVARMLLGIDDPDYRIYHRNGNLLDHRRENLIAVKMGESSTHVMHAPAFGLLRRQALMRAQGVCEVCRLRRGAEVHQMVPVRFRRSDASFLPDLRVVCKRCHREEHMKIHAAAEKTDSLRRKPISIAQPGRSHGLIPHLRALDFRPKPA